VDRLTNPTAMREEIFGPVAGCSPFDNGDEAIALANAPSTGSVDGMDDRPLSRAPVAQRMNVGMSWVNTWFLRDLRSPFGGVGLSGIGREGGEHSLILHRATNVCVQL